MVARWISELSFIFTWGILLIGAGQMAIVAQEGSNFQLLHDAGLIIRLKNLEEGQPPFVSHNLLFFTYKGNTQTQVVGIAFESEGFANLKMLERNAHNVFIYVVPLPAEGRVAYRYWVDGLWQRDPVNPLYYLDSYEVAISFYENNDLSRIQGINPVTVGNSYDFYARFAPGQDVYILGSFNNWNPFIAPLEQKRLIEPELAEYYIRIQHLVPGDYQYYFWVGGFKRLDALNPREAINSSTGEQVSIFTVHSQK